MERRFGDDASIAYFNLDDPEIRAEHSAMAEELETRGLLYPVTVIDGVPLYDGAVSYPAIMRAVNNALLERSGAEV